MSCLEKSSLYKVFCVLCVQGRQCSMCARSSVFYVPWHSGEGECSQARQQGPCLWVPDVAVRTIIIITFHDMP